MMNVSSRRWFPGIADVLSNIRGLPLPFDLFHLRAVIEAPNGKPRSIAPDSAARLVPRTEQPTLRKADPGQPQWLPQFPSTPQGFRARRMQSSPGRHSSEHRCNAVSVARKICRTSSAAGRGPAGMVREQPTAVL